MAEKLGVHFVRTSTTSLVRKTQCTDADFKKYPDISFNINGKQYNLPPTSYIYKSPTSGVCFLLLIPKDYFTTPQYILGNIFLNNYHTIYDLENKQIGLIKSKEINYASNQYEETELFTPSEDVAIKPALDVKLGTCIGAFALLAILVIKKKIDNDKKKVI